MYAYLVLGIFLVAGDGINIGEAPHGVVSIPITSTASASAAAATAASVVARPPPSRRPLLVVVPAAAAVAAVTTASLASSGAATSAAAVAPVASRVAEAVERPGPTPSHVTPGSQRRPELTRETRRQYRWRCAHAARCQDLLSEGVRLCDDCLVTGVCRSIFSCRQRHDARLLRRAATLRVHRAYARLHRTQPPEEEIEESDDDSEDDLHGLPGLYEDVWPPCRAGESTWCFMHLAAPQRGGAWTVTYSMYVTGTRSNSMLATDGALSVGCAPFVLMGYHNHASAPQRRDVCGTAGTTVSLSLMF